MRLPGKQMLKFLPALREPRPRHRGRVSPRAENLKPKRSSWKLQRSFLSGFRFQGFRFHPNRDRDRYRDRLFNHGTHGTHRNRKLMLFRVFGVFRGYNQKLRSAPNRCGAISTEANIYGALLKIRTPNCSFQVKRPNAQGRRMRRRARDASPSRRSASPDHGTGGRVSPRAENLNLKDAAEPSTLFGFRFQGFSVSGFIQIGIGIAIGIDCLTTEHPEHTETEPCLSVCSVCSVVTIRSCVLHQTGAAAISTEANIYGALLKIRTPNCSFQVKTPKRASGRRMRRRQADALPLPALREPRPRHPRASVLNEPKI